MPFKDHYVIIGNGPAGNHAAAILRENNKDARITIISDECIAFYYKPKLTRFIAGEINKEELMVTSLESYRKKNIRLRCGQAVERIDPDSKTLFLQHMEKISYSRLIIASGSRARVLPSMSRYSDHLKFVTSYADVIEYKEKIQKAKDFFVFGGDLVGFKFLRMLTDMGKTVTVLIYPNAFWPYNLNDAMLKQIVGSLSKYTSDIIVKDDISTIDAQNGSYRVKTQKGIEKNVDMVFSFNGLSPNIDFAKGSGIDTDHGILVDEYLRTNIDGIYACGSCAQIYNRDIQSYTVSIGWPNAVAQGETAALNLLGDHKVVESTGRKYFDLEGVKIKTTWWEDIDDEL
ncbi:NAD(P)/FAD-dependent oxidoreductase [Desulfobacula phenolica]|uniref:Nitrite reductase (NADH) large subunit n=1 Tax=Desulfobacula phenolica TaxID=90732 RepID=A0A1H2HZ23_9BACT|nr:FAD-dependent oxidoreductase [Desulfobacula phenolica]SDU36999.1 nitrite reductase (NADH) large subunit [Desulfobacula phenolica]